MSYIFAAYATIGIFVVVVIAVLVAMSVKAKIDYLLARKRQKITSKKSEKLRQQLDCLLASKRQNETAGRKH